MLEQEQQQQQHIIKFNYNDFMILQMIGRIRLAMLARLDRCTMTFINSDPKRYMGPEGNNLLVEGQLAGGRMAYCLWGNVAKDPRYVYITTTTSFI